MEMSTKRVKQIILIYGCLTFFVWSFFSNILGLVLNSLIKELNLPYTMGGLLFSFSSVGFTLGAFITGWAAEKLLPKTVLLISLILFLGGHVLIIFSSTIYPVIAAFMIIGLSGGGMITIMSSSVSRIHENQRSRSLNFLEIFFSLGAISTPLLINLLNAPQKWRLPYIAALVIGLFLLLCLFGLRKIPLSSRESSQKGPENPEKNKQKGINYLSILKPALVLGLAVFFAAGGLEWGGSVWLPTLFTEERGYSQSISRYLMTFLWTGFLLSRILAARFIDQFDIDKILTFTLVLSTAALTTIVVVESELIAMLGIFIFGLGLGCLFPALLGRLVDLSPHLAVPITAAAMTIASLGSNLTPLSVGALSDTLGMKIAIWSFPLLGLLGTLTYIFYLMVRKKHPAKTSSRSRDKQAYQEP